MANHRNSAGLTALLVAIAWASTASALSEVTITTTGVDAETRDALEDRLRGASLSARTLDEQDADGAVPPTPLDLLGVARSDYARMISVLYAQGFYGPTVSVKVDGREVADIDPFSPPQSVERIAITVNPGPSFRFGRTDVAPRAPGADPSVPLADGFERGKPALSGLVGTAANGAVREWREGGHAKATVGTQSITADHARKRLDVDVGIAPGPKLRFGKLTIGGETDVSERRVRQILGYPEGDVYSPDELRDSVNRIRRTGTFSVVTMTEAETPNPDGTLDYDLTLIEELPRRYGFSAEYATIDGVTVGGFWLHRNLFGGAERLRFDAEVSNIGGETTGFNDKGGIDYSADLRFTRPGSFGPDNDLFVFGSFDSIEDPEFNETQFTLGVGVSRYFSDELYGELAIGLRYSDVEDSFGQREFYHLVFPGRLEWDTRDDPGDASRGFYLDTQVTPYVGLEDSENGTVIDIDARTYRGFGEGNRVILAGRVQIGSVLGSSLEGTPPDFLFYSGGGDTVRGQKYQSLGVDLDNGDTSGGRSFLGVSGELRTRISGALGAVAFIDAGFVGPDSYLSDAGEWQSGVGLGVRYATPIGPLRVDIGTPWTGAQDAFSRVELYIGVGQAF